MSQKPDLKKICSICNSIEVDGDVIFRPDCDPEVLEGDEYTFSHHLLSKACFLESIEGNPEADLMRDIADTLKHERCGSFSKLRTYTREDLEGLKLTQETIAMGYYVFGRGNKRFLFSRSKSGEYSFVDFYKSTE